jgi:hypothetical protein
VVIQRSFTLRLDRETSEKTPTCYLYRSEEMADGRPVIDGVYFQRSALSANPPEKLSVQIDYDFA